MQADITATEAGMTDRLRTTITTITTTIITITTITTIIAITTTATEQDSSTIIQIHDILVTEDGMRD